MLVFESSFFANGLKIGKNKSAEKLLLADDSLGMFMSVTSLITTLVIMCSDYNGY